MAGRTMFVVPYCMGPIDSPLAGFGVELTDSPYVVVNMHIMARVGSQVLELSALKASSSRDCTRWARRSRRTIRIRPGPATRHEKWICHFPETREVGLSAPATVATLLLGKKCHALRIASVQARDEGWMAEHMLIMKLTNPEGMVKYIAGAFPSACGKTNLSMLIPTIPGWKVEAIGDDIAGCSSGTDGRLYAINPETGFFGVAPGTSLQSNANAMDTISRNSVFTNCAITPDGDIWWEGMTAEKPSLPYRLAAASVDP